MAQFTIIVFSLALVFLASTDATGRAVYEVVEVIDFEDPYFREQVELLTPELFKLLNIEDPQSLAAELRATNLTSPVWDENSPDGGRDYYLDFDVLLHAITSHICQVGLAWYATLPVEGKPELHIVNGPHCFGPPILANQKN